ncbi:ABC transporter ATP-binding protein [Polaromonas sp. JS666]|uniref:ABC transporter ATP-binding protein n=1 Tax=Polaromonas sp. (strain JS666 / ATCC BAA-500) TaxID=296591 RepID=UPI0000537A5F|nr:ABC transporter ATP-binding protein [Polaromonas sp. JS666]ABE42320.1 amino acid/amide ABC transporter ATP-binding protein 2, HAAT family [Polaromonas sp. JS666]
MLDVKDLKVSYGEVPALRGVSLVVKKNEIVTVIGANGAGKSTLLRTISGLSKVKGGTIEFDGIAVGSKQPQDVVKLGIAHVPEGRHVFPLLSVEDNLKVGAYLNRRKQVIAEDLDRAFSMFPRLAERRHQAAGTLSGGEQQMLALGRAMMTRPRLLLLDEPSLGLAPKIVDEVIQTIVKFRSEGVTILLVEQNANLALAIADRAYVMTLGQVTLSGSASEVQADPAVRASYLGEIANDCMKD